MKQSFHSLGLLFFFIFILFSYTTTATSRGLLISTPNQGEQVNLQKGLMAELEQDDPSNMMGLTKCQNEDEECLKRRELEEAHLDYIYTQEKKT